MPRCSAGEHRPLWQTGGETHVGELERRIITPSPALDKEEVYAPKEARVQWLKGKLRNFAGNVVEKVDGAKIAGPGVLITVNGMLGYGPWWSLQAPLSASASQEPTGFGGKIFPVAAIMAGIGAANCGAVAGKLSKSYDFAIDSVIGGCAAAIAAALSSAAAMGTYFLLTTPFPPPALNALGATAIVGAGGIAAGTAIAVGKALRQQ